MKTRFWILLFLSIAVVCAGLSIWLLGGKAETTAEVYSDGALVQTIDLAVDGVLVFVGAAAQHGGRRCEDQDFFHRIIFL